MNPGRTPVALVTGATDGIGRQTAAGLAEKGFHVLLHGRDPRRLSNAVEAVSHRASPAALVQGFCADFTALSEVERMAKKITSSVDRLDVLINNAGTWQNHRVITSDGFEKTFQVNYLSHFLLACRLLPLLNAAGRARIVNVTSMLHGQASDLQDLQGEDRYSGLTAYAKSKLCMVMFTLSLAERLGGKGPSVNCLHPGVISTKLLRRGGWGGGRPVRDGAENVLFITLDPAPGGVTGAYFSGKSQASPSPVARDAEWKQRLWDFSENAVGGKCAPRDR